MQSEDDPCVYFKLFSSSTILMSVTIYYSLFKGPSSNNNLDKFLSHIRQKYSVKVLGHPMSFSGCTIDYSSSGYIKMFQPTLVAKVAAKLNPTQGHSRRTHLPHKTYFNYRSSPILLYYSPKYLYMSALGYFRYLADGARLSISLFASTLAQCMSLPRSRHVSLLKQLFRYLISTKTYYITYNNSSAFPITQLHVRRIRTIPILQTANCLLLRLKF